jgi:hypothetical protein
MSLHSKTLSSFRAHQCFLLFISTATLSAQLYRQSTCLNTYSKVVSLNSVHGEVCSIQHYVIKCVSDLWQLGGFLRVLRFLLPRELKPRKLVLPPSQVSINYFRRKTNQVRIDWLVNGILRHFQQYFSYIVAVSLSGRRNRSTRRKPPSCHKSLTHFIT